MWLALVMVSIVFAMVILAVLGTEEASVLVLSLICIVSIIAMGAAHADLLLWPGVMLFLAFVGGLMILFMFVISSAPPAKTTLKLSHIGLVIGTFILGLMSPQMSAAPSGPITLFLAPGLGVLLILGVLNLVLLYIAKILNNPLRSLSSSA